MDKIYDVIILGAGPGGLAAGIYAGRVRLDTLLIKRERGGGQIVITDEIENYPGQMIDGESDPSLVGRMTKQIERSGAERVSNTIVSANIEGPVGTLIGNSGTYKTHALVITTDAFPRPIGCKGEGESMGKGVSHCATCDASFFEDLEVFVAGGGNSVIEEAMYLTKFARKATAIHRRDELRAVKSIQERMLKNSKLFLMWNTAVEELHGDGTLSSMTVKNAKTGEPIRIDADEDDGLLGVLSFTGHNPRGELFEGKLGMDRGYIKTDEDMHTNVEGVYAVGDIRIRSLRQAITATVDGAITSMQVEG